MPTIRLGRTNIVTEKNAFGALPIQRLSIPEAGKLLRKAFEGGMTFFDTARGYTDSEEKIGYALSDIRDKIFIASKTGSNTPEGFWKDLHTSLSNLKTDYIDIYQFHNPSFIPMPDDGSGLYECMIKAKKEGKIRHISITNHKLDLAIKAVESDLYDTLQFPFCYLANEKEEALVKLCEEKDVGFICMKALSGGLITNSKAAYAYLNQFPVLPIWGIQKENELDEFLSYFSNPPQMTQEIKLLIDKEREDLCGNFCRGCGYCMPCPVGIQINMMARMSLLLKRAPTSNFISEQGKENMKKIEDCLDCGLCKSKCPYELDTPQLLRENYKDYMNFISAG